MWSTDRMPDYRRQHYLPCAYLKNFSSDGIDATRFSKIWCWGERRDATAVAVDEECFGNYLFSKSDPAGAEAELKAVDDRFDLATRKIWDGGPPTVREYFSLIYAAFDFHARNIAHRNGTGNEGLVAYRDRLTTLMNRLVVGNESAGPLSPENMLCEIGKTWTVRLVRSPGPSLMTSDNPSLCFVWPSEQTKEKASFLLLPVTSQVCAIVFDTRSTQVSGNALTENDGRVLIDLAARYCNRFVYTSHKPTETLVTHCRAIWASRQRELSTTSSTQWSTYLIVPSRADLFSFVRPIE